MENENRSGEFRAANRAEAYALLRKQGIRPYRVLGDDPLPWRPVVMAVLPVLTAVAAFFLAVRFFSGDKAGPVARSQLQGDRALIFDGVRAGWKDAFGLPLDRYLAAYAQPGTEARPPLLSSAELDGLEGDLRRTTEPREDEGPELRQLRGIVAGMREEMRKYLDGGHTVAEYLEWLEQRQRQEREFRTRAEESLARTPRNLRYEAWKSLNARLLERGLEQLPVPEGLPLE